MGRIALLVRVAQRRQEICHCNEALDSSFPLGSDIVPEMDVRGFQLHTLHPIEALWAFWVPDPTHLAQARKILDWSVKSRANFVQWVPLDDIDASDELHAAWKDHTRAILEEARLRGLRTGINVQLFAGANLQHAFDLLEDEEGEDSQRAAMEARLEKVLGDLPFDSVTLSFGEFLGAEPESFIAGVNLAYEAIQTVAPGIDVTALIHVGELEGLQVEYRGERMLYYFLVQFADPSIVPWVHTVMFYGLYNDAGGAYFHDDFSDHREFLLDRLRAQERVAYFPETSYWVAFDNSVPLYLPVYMRSRWEDLHRLEQDAEAAGAPPLTEHVAFTTGWEWGYWQNDYATLRWCHTGADDWRPAITDMLKVLGNDGTDLAAAVADLAELQAHYLIDRRLAAYLAGRDAVIDAGDRFDIVSQPDRIRFDEIADLDADERDRLEAIRADLGSLAEETSDLLEEVAALDLPADDPWVAEIRDGIEINVLRTRFMEALLRAVALDEAGALDEAQTLLTAAEEVVARRAGALHYDDPERLLGSAPNPTIYHYGYLKMADTLCYWRREQLQARAVVLGSDDAVPDCIE